jgi:dGTPase
MPDNDHVHTRLSHTLEVASVGRSLGARAGINLANSEKLPTSMVPQDVGAILQAACLAHDIGNPPFGHAGEFAIRGWFQKESNLSRTTSPSANSATRFSCAHAETTAHQATAEFR